MARKRLYANDAEKAAAHRARHNVVAVTVLLPADLVAELQQWMKFKDLTQGQVIEKLLRSQLLRKR